MKKFVKSKKKKGFTLIELLVVIGIIGVLSLVAAPTIMSKLDDAKEKADISNASSIATAVKTEIVGGKSFPEVLTTENLTDLATEYFDSKIPAPQSIKDKPFQVKITGNTVTIIAGEMQFYPEYKAVVAGS